MGDLTVSLIGAGDGLPAFNAAERQVLDRVNQKVAAAESLEALIDFLFEAVQPVFECDRVGVSFLEEGGTRLIAHYARTAYEPVLLKKGYSEELAEGSLGQVIESGRPRILRDLEEHLARRPSSRSTRILVREGVRSSMTCPLLVEGRTAGLLFFSSRRPDAYAEHHVRLHLAIAERLAQAVEKARRIEELAEANRAYSEMLGFVSHELKSPLASIVMDAHLLTEGYVGVMPEAQRDVVVKINRKADYLLNIVREYLDLARIEGGELTLEARGGIDLMAEVIEPACEIVRALADEKRMHLERRYPASPAIATCDPELLRIVALNLLGNAVKYGREGGFVRAATGSAPSGAWFSVWNEGPGFPAGLRPRLFRRFSRLETPELKKQKGTGVGLYTCWRIVTLHGGRIDASSEEGSWAEFRVDLPGVEP